MEIHFDSWYCFEIDAADTNAATRYTAEFVKQMRVAAGISNLFRYLENVVEVSKLVKGNNVKKSSTVFFKHSALESITEYT